MRCRSTRVPTSGRSVFGQLLMWASVLSERSLFDSTQQALAFDSLADFELDVGVEDDSWLKTEPGEKRKTLEGRRSDQLRLL